MGHPAFRQKPAAGIIAHFASWLPHTHTHTHARACRNAHKRGAYTKRFCLRVGTRRSSSPWEGSGGERERTGEALQSPFVSRLTSKKQTVHGLAEHWCIFRAPCENFHPRFPLFLPHSFSQPGCIRSRRRRHFRLLPPSDQPSPRWLGVLVSLGSQDRDLVFLL